MPANIIDENIDEIIKKFAYVVNKDNVYQIPLRYFCGLGKMNYLKKSIVKSHVILRRI